MLPSSSVVVLNDIVLYFLLLYRTSWGTNRGGLARSEAVVAKNKRESKLKNVMQGNVFCVKVVGRCLLASICVLLCAGQGNRWPNGQVSEFDETDCLPVRL